MGAGRTTWTLPWSAGKAATSDRATRRTLSRIGATRLVPCYLAALTAGAAGATRRSHRISRRCAATVLDALSVKVTVTGLGHVDPRRRYLVAPLHEGLADPLVLAAHLPLDLTFSAREELFSWQSLGPYLTAAGHLRIPEEGPAAYRSLLAGAPKVLARGESLVVFPQGSVLGIEIAFARGVAGLARRLGAPVLPVVLTGTHRIWHHPFDPLVETHRSVRMRILAPIPAAEVPRRWSDLERTMKTIAVGDPDVRRYEPDRDGWWDGYRFEIDPAFPDLAERVADHRRVPTRQPAWT